MTDRDRLEADQDHRVYTVPSPTGHPALTCCSHEEPRTRNVEDDVKYGDLLSGYCFLQRLITCQSAPRKYTTVSVPEVHYFTVLRTR